MTAAGYIERYGADEFTFSSYYKYTFLYKHPSGETFVTVGGSAGDIYRADLKQSMPLVTLLYEAGWDNATAFMGEDTIDLDEDDADEAAMQIRSELLRGNE